MNKVLRIAIPSLAALLSACTAGGHGPRPVDVTRYHLGAAVVPGSVRVEPRSAFAGVGPEDQLYTAAVAAELARLGYAPGAGEAAEFVAQVSYTRTSRGEVRKRPPVTIGVGGGSYGGSVGVGGGASFGIGGGRAELYVTELAVQLKRRDGTIVWEGRAITDGLSGTDGGQPGATAERLARALFKGFPGESGITITVR